MINVRYLGEFGRKGLKSGREGKNSRDDNANLSPYLFP